MNTDLNFLKHAITSLENDQEFMAHTLKKYRDFEQISEPAMLDFLSCTMNDYYKLALCRIPDTDKSDYLSRMNAISEYTNIEPGKLLRLIKHVRIGLALDKQQGTYFLITQETTIHKKNNA